MFCYQCEQTVKGEGCSFKKGVCGKTDVTADMQDLVVASAKSVSQLAHRLRQNGIVDREADHYVIEALFATVTNVDFDPDRLEKILRRFVILRDRLKQAVEAKTDVSVEDLDLLDGIVLDQDALLEKAEDYSIAKRQEELGEVVTGLQELSLYGLKGSAAYADHARVLGVEDDDVYGWFHESLDYLSGNPTDINELTAKALNVGELNLRVMEMLDEANTSTYGHPEPTQARITPVKGKCILVSGHDLKDLDLLLKQTAGKNINVYTHGEMLPCLAYPELKKYPHLVGNYGGAWQDQQKEFAEFPGAILMTTNCIQKPRDDYANRIFTSGLVAWPGIRHCGDGDFSPVIEAALAAPGFEEDAEEKRIPIGFARNTVINAADKILELVKEGKIRHFFLVGGCDGAKSGRNYYTELAEKIPEDCMIMTLACGKYRFNKMDFGTIDGLPRLIDCGQCNDAYSAIRIALALADALDCGVNDLPLSLILSWYEQKAVTILLTLLHLGIEDMRLGPTLPAFITEPVLDILVEKYGIKPISTPEEDLQAILG
ncbi:MAG: hydroxylamine reductase [Candidatus Sumerlaeota bacterium]